jgi:hypothetical protein
MYASNLSEVVTLLRPSISEPLVDAGSLARIERLAAIFPASSFGYLGFERPLGQRDRGTDFAFSLSRAGCDWIRTAGPWPVLSAFADRWCAERRPSDELWLEFDTSTGAVDDMPPNVFIDLDYRVTEGRALLRMLGSLADVLSESPAEGRVNGRHLATCLAACPSTVNRMQLGFMLARETSSLRICMGPLSRSEGIAFLSAVEWPGDLGDAGDVMLPYELLCDGFCLQLDANRSSRAVAVEMRFRGLAWECRPECEPRWFALFDRLVADGMCTETERAALVGSFSRSEFDAPLIERSIAAAYPSHEKLICGTLYTGLNHLKVTIGAERRPTAKAYFGAYLEPPRGVGTVRRAGTEPTAYDVLRR